MEIIFEELNSTGIIKLNRPKALNALNLDMAKYFSNKLNEWEKNNKIKQVILIGEGKHFCAGGDVKKISLDGKSSKLRRDFFLIEYKLNYQINNFSKPYLSIWNGVVMGGGIGLSIYGDFRIVTDTTKLAMPETSIGFFPDVGGSYFLSRLTNNYGMFMALTGHVINSNEILELGLGTNYCPSNEIENLIDKFVMTGTIKKYEKPKDIKIQNINFINECFVGNIKNIFKKLEESNDNIAKEYLNILRQKCPMSLAVTSDLINKGKIKNLKECLEMEYNLSQIMVYREDFDNGIDAVLISKHHNPKWNPASINDITENDVNKMFEFKDKKILF